MPPIYLIKRSAESRGAPSIAKSKEDSEMDYTYDDDPYRWQEFSRFDTIPKALFCINFYNKPSLFIIVLRLIM